MAQPRVYLFWDNSNIFISAKHVAEKNEGGNARYDVRVHFTNLYRLAAAGRPVEKAVVVGSIPPEQQDLWDRMKQDTGIDPELYERGSSSGKEQGLDQCLQIHMLRAGADEDEPQIAVLLTGDGAGYDVGSGFHADLERMRKKGWGVEVIAWDSSCKRDLKEWAQREGVFVKLEDYYWAVTFTEGLRPVDRLNLTHRGLAGVGASKDSTLEAEGTGPDANDLQRKINKLKYQRTQDRRQHLARKQPKKGRRRH